MRNSWLGTSFAEKYVEVTVTHKLNMYQQCHTISAKAKHAALVLSDACLVLCNELRQMWRQKKERKVTRELENMSCAAELKGARDLIYWMNDWRDMRSLQVIKDYHFLSKPTVNRTRKECAKIITGKNHVTKNFLTVKTRQEGRRKLWNLLFRLNTLVLSQEGGSRYHFAPLSVSVSPNSLFNFIVNFIICS